jgi:5-methylcytosine-specific restriction protein A
VTLVVTASRARDLQVKAWVLDRAAGACEACSEPAPFVGTNGFPFLEVHHMRHLADGGSDSHTNAIAICPNCHRRLHHSKDAREYREGIWAKLSTLIRE